MLKRNIFLFFSFHDFKNFYPDILRKNILFLVNITYYKQHKKFSSTHKTQNFKKVKIEKKIKTNTIKIIHCQTYFFIFSVEKFHRNQNKNTERDFPDHFSIYYIKVILKIIYSSKSTSTKNSHRKHSSFRIEPFFNNQTIKNIKLQNLLSYHIFKII